jgi:DNA-binding Xre family transcriptional regulator
MVKQLVKSYILKDRGVEQLKEKPKDEMSIGNNIKQLLDRKGESINQMSKALGVTYVTAHALYHNTTNSINYDLLNRLCKYFGVGPGEILIYLPDPDNKGGE